MNLIFYTKVNSQCITDLNVKQKGRQQPYLCLKPSAWLHCRMTWKWPELCKHNGQVEGEPSVASPDLSGFEEGARELTFTKRELCTEYSAKCFLCFISFNPKTNQ